MVEEDVHELPEHVVERLDELLADRRVGRRRLELPLGAGGREREREAAALARDAATRAARAPPSRRSPRPHRSRSRCRRARPAARPGPPGSPPSPARPMAGSARLPTITGCTNSTATCRASERAAGERPKAISRPPRANRSAIRWQSAREPLGLRVEEVAVRARPVGERALDDVGSERWRHTRASAGAPPAAREPVAPLVDALPRLRARRGFAPRRGAPGRGCRGTGRGRSRGAAAGRSC